MHSHHLQYPCCRMSHLPSRPDQLLYRTIAHQTSPKVALKSQMLTRQTRHIVDRYANMSFLNIERLLAIRPDTKSEVDPVRKRRIGSISYRRQSAEPG